MATHRQKSKKRIRTGELAVAAFLGLAVTAAPAIATADTTDGPSNGPSTHNDRTSKDAKTDASSRQEREPHEATSGPKSESKAESTIGSDHSTSAGGGAGTKKDEDDEPDDSLGGAVEQTPGAGGIDTSTTGTGPTDPVGTQTPTATDPTAVPGGGQAPQGEAPTGTGTEQPPAVEPPVVEPPAVEPPAVEPPAAESPLEVPKETATVDVIEIPSSDHNASALALRGTDPAPTPTALASALLDLDIVPKPPVIPEFGPLMGIINGLASWVDSIFPPYAADPILNPTQVAAGYVMTLMAGLQTSYWNGYPTPFTFGALVLVTAAYSRYERLALNHLPGAPTISAGPLPMTWKLKSTDPDGDPLVYSVDLSGQPSNGLITMSPDGTFSFIPSSLGDFNNGTDVTFTVRVNDFLGVLDHPIAPDGNDAYYTVSFHYPGLGINNLPVFTGPGKATVTGTDGNTGKVTIVAEATDADGDPLTYTASALFGTVTRNADGTFTYTPNAAARHAAAGDLAAALGLNKDLVSIWANDGRGGITLLPTTVSVEIVGANAAPVVTANPPAISDPITGLIAGGFTVHDDDNDLITFTPGLLTTDRGGLVTVTGLGYTYLPSLSSRSQGGTDTFTVTADDGHGGQVAVSITVTIAKFNISPVGGITLSAPDSDGVVRGHVAATDLNGDTITFTLAGGASSGLSEKGGIVLLQSDGTFTYIPKPSTSLIPGLTTDSFEVQLSDGNGGFATTTVTVFADLKLDPKVTSNSNGVITGGVGIDNADNVGLLTYSVGSGPSKGNVTVNADGTYTYTATSVGWNETDSFTIVGTVNGLSITVATVNLVPKPNVAPTSELVDGAVIPIGVGSGIATGNVNAHDENGDTLHYSVVGYGGASTMTLSNGSVVTVDASGKWTYIPGLNSGDLNGLSPIITGSSFTVYVTDGKGGQTSTPVIVTTHELDLPVTKIVNNGTVTGGLGLTASEQGLMTYSVGTGPNKGTITVNADGSYTYTATSAGWNETDSFTIVGHIGDQTITVANVSVVPKSNAAPTVDPIDLVTIIGGSGIASGNIGASDANGDTLHYSVDGYGGGSTKVLSNGAIVTVDATGKWTYIPGVNSGDPVFGAIVASSFTVYVTDGKGGQASTPVVVTTHNLNIPVSTVGSNGTVTGGLSLTAGEQGLMTYKLGNAPGKGNVTVNADGTYTYTATTAGWNQSDSFSIVGVINGVEITVADVSFVPKSNTAPSSPLTDGATIIGGSGIATGNIGASDANGDTLHYSVDGYGGGSTKVLSNGSIVTVDSTGKWTYIPGVDSGDLGGLVSSIALSTFTVYVTDGKGGQTSTTVVVNTHELNIPVSVVNTNGTVTGGLSLTAGEQGLMTYKLGNAPGKGNVTVNADGTYTYTATTAGWNQSDSFSIVGVINGVEITVANVSFVPKSNAAPNAKDLDGATIIGGTGIATGNVNATDANNDSLHYSVDGYGGASSKVLSNGSIVTVDANGKWSYIPGLNSGDPVFGAIALSTFTVYVTDGKGGQTSTFITVNTHSLDVPVTATPVGTGVVNGGLTLPTGEQGILTYSASTPGRGTVTVNPDGTFHYVRTASGHVGGADDSFDILGSVGGVSIVIANVSVTPVIPNQSPAAGTTTVTDSSLTNVLGVYWQETKGNINALDADGDALSYQTTPLGKATTNGGLVYVSSDGSFTYRIGKLRSYYHDASATGASGNAVSDTFSITVTDSLGASSTIVVSIPIEKVNSGPSSTASVGGKTTDALGVVRGAVNGSDDDDDALTYTLVGGTNGVAATANGGIVRFSGGSFTYIPTAGKATDSFQVQVNDGHGGISTATVSLTGLSTPSATTGVNTSTANVVTGQLNTAGNTGLTYSVGGQGTKGTVTVSSTGAFTYTRNSALGHTQTPGDTFTIKATDANGNSVIIATVNVTPTVTNSAPTGNGVTVGSSSLTTVDIGINRQQTTTGTLKAADADGDAVTFTAGTYDTANGGSVTVNADGTFSYSIKKIKNTIFGGQDSYWHDAAVPGAPGDTFTIVASDLFGGSSTLSFSIPIEKLNNGPASTVSVGGKTTDALGVVRGTVTGSDDDDDALTYTLVGGTNGVAATANGGIVRFSGGSFTYIPTAGKATDSFQVQVNDGHGGISTATVSLTGLSTPSATTGVNTSTANVVTGQLNTAGNTGLTYSVGGQGTKGTVTVSSTGAFTYTRNAALGHTQSAGDTFTIKATDANGNSVIIATVNVTPTVNNTAPVAGTTVFTGLSIDDNRVLGIGTLKQTTTGTLKATDADGDSVTFTAGSFSTANGGTVVINANGTFTYTIDEGFSYYHGAAKIGASGGAVADSFSATASDGFGGNTSYSVSVAIYAINSTPTISGGSKAFGNVSFVNVDDNDGDSLTFSHNGSSFTFGGRGLATSTLWGGARLTVTDGYYVTANGVVTGTPSTVTKTW